MIEKLQGQPNIEIQYGGPATADEVYNELSLLQEKINEVIEAVNELQKTLQK